MRQRERHVDTPSTSCWAPSGGSHTRGGSHAGWDTSGYRYTRPQLQAGSDAVPSGIPDAQTQHSTLQHNRLHASLERFARRGSFLQAPCEHAQYLCEYQQYRCRRLVPDVSTHGYAVWVPMPVLRKAHAATQRYSCGRPKYPMRVPVVLHESTRSTLSDRLQYPCEYSEYRM